MDEPLKFDEALIECSPGWKGLYLPLIKLCDDLGVRVLQVKEKYGAMRFSVQYPTNWKGLDLRIIIAAAEDFSYYVCEECGVSGGSWDNETNQYVKNVVTCGSRHHPRWIRSLCKKCHDGHGGPLDSKQ